MKENKIEAKEIRVGNYVNTTFPVIESHKLVRVGIITPTKINAVGIDKFEPIPLTEEWLLKFGFVYEKENNSYQLDTEFGFSIWGRVETGFYIYAESDELGRKMQFLHEIQNAFHALTNEELTTRETNQ